MNIPEADELLTWLLDNYDESVIDDIIQIAMNRHQVKKGRRFRTQLILETAFEMALERAQEIKEIRNE